MNVTAVVVSWNVKEHIGRCLDSVQDAVTTIVIDNASTDGTPGFIRTSYPHVKLVVNTTNRGFAAAVNQGIVLSKTDTVLLLNPDAHLLPGALGTLVKALDHHPGAAAVAPKILNPDGSIQSTRRRFPTLLTAFLESTVIQDHFAGLAHLQRFYSEDVPEEEEQEVDWSVGACLLIRRAATTSLGLLDERFFMYFEEVDWFLRAHRAGWSARYVPTARAVHHGGASAGQVPKLAHLYFAASKRAFYAKHYGFFAGAAVHAFNLLSYLLRAFEDACKLALGHRPALRRTRISLYLSVLRGSISASY